MNPELRGLTRYSTTLEAAHLRKMDRGFMTALHSTMHKVSTK